MPDEIKERLALMSNPGLPPQARNRIAAAIRQGEPPRRRTARSAWPWFAGSVAVAAMLFAAVLFGPGGAHLRPGGPGPSPAARGAGQSLVRHYPVVKALTAPNGYPDTMVTLPVVVVPMTHAVTGGPKPRIPKTVSLALAHPRAPGMVAYAVWLGQGPDVAYFVGPAGLGPYDGHVGADGSWGVKLTSGRTTITLSSVGGCLGCAAEAAAPYFESARRAAASDGRSTGPTLKSTGVATNALDAYDRVFAYRSEGGITVASGVRYAPGPPAQTPPGGAFFQETIVTAHPSRLAISVILDEGLVQASGYPLDARTYAQARPVVIGRLVEGTSVPLWLPSSLPGQPTEWLDALYWASKESYAVSFGLGSDLPLNAPGLGFGNAELMMTVEGAGPGGSLSLEKWIPLPSGSPIRNAAQGMVSLGPGTIGTTFTGSWEGQAAEAVRFTEHGWTVWVGPIPTSDGGAIQSATDEAKSLRSLTFPAPTGTIVFGYGIDAPSEAVFASGPDRYAVESLGWSAAKDVARMAPVWETKPAPPQ